MGTFKGLSGQLLLAASSLLALLSFTGCEQSYSVALSNPNSSNSADSIGGISVNGGPVCHPADIQVPLRILLMVDNSGSTQTTDPGDRLRVQTLEDFIATYGGNSNLSYSFSYFAGTSAFNWDMGGLGFIKNNFGTAFGDSTGLSAALTGFQAITGNGNTPYKAAFNALSAEIAADGAAGTRVGYAVLFMSDGQPTDLAGNQVNAIQNLVAQLGATAKTYGNPVSVNAIYFGPESGTQGIANLEAMANAGAGQFIDTNQTTNLNINTAISVPSSLCN